VSKLPCHMQEASAGLTCGCPAARLPYHPLTIRAALKRIHLFQFTLHRARSAVLMLYRYCDGLPKLRRNWIEERSDTEVLRGLSSECGKQRANDLLTVELRSPSRPTASRSSRLRSDANALRAEGHHHCGDGVRRASRVHPSRGTAFRPCVRCAHSGRYFGANLCTQITPKFVRDERG